MSVDIEDFWEIIYNIISTGIDKFFLYGRMGVVEELKKIKRRIDEFQHQIDKYWYYREEYLIELEKYMDKYIENMNTKKNSIKLSENEESEIEELEIEESENEETEIEESENEEDLEIEETENEESLEIKEDLEIEETENEINLFFQKFFDQFLSYNIESSLVKFIFLSKEHLLNNYLIEDEDFLNTSDNKIIYKILNQIGF